MSDLMLSFPLIENNWFTSADIFFLQQVGNIIFLQLSTLQKEADIKGIERALILAPA